MLWFVLVHLLGFFVDLLIFTRQTNRERDLQILVLQHQLRLLHRERPRPRHLTRCEKLTLAVLTAKLVRMTTGPHVRLDQALLLFKPETVLRWHRELVRRKWTCRWRSARGRPATPVEVEELILRLAWENPSWGYSCIQGELTKLGYSIERSTVRDVLKRQGIRPAPQRRWGNTWGAFLRRHQDQLLACDFFTVETLFFKTVYVLFLIELGTRRVHLTPAAPTSPRPPG